ncbi:MAG: phosphatase PAP2 family protein [Acidimicrobiales bacterium]
MTSSSTPPADEPAVDPHPFPSGEPPAALPVIGSAIEAAEAVLPHPIEHFAERGPHDLEPPHDLGPIARFDQTIDEAFNVLRGNVVADRLFYAATELGDFGLVWVLLAWTHGLRSEKDLATALKLTATLGVESVVVNGLIKQLFKRERPVSQEPRPYKMRMPLTTSFPSGHSSTAVVAATLLSVARPRAAPVYWAVAGIVASSRVYVRIHHASDVVGGVATGLVIGTAARVFWKKVAR